MSTPLTLPPHAAARRSNANLSSPADANEHADADDGELDMELQTFFPRRTAAITASSDPLPLSAIRQPWKRSLHALLEHPNSSPSAFLIHITTTSLILLSALVTILETIPAFHATSARVWFGIETALVVLFTVEYVARSLAWSVRWDTFLSWFFSFFGIIDLLAILPYYVELLLGVDTSVMFRFSILRTFRLLRVFRAFRTNNTIMLTIEVMYLSVKRSQHALLALGFFLLMFLVIFSTILYFAERGTWDPTLETFIDGEGEVSQFSSIPAAAWFVLVTITTVGYGEITPRSFLGRLLTVPLLICGLLLIALPSFVLGREFAQVWEEMSLGAGPGADGESVPLTPSVSAADNILNTRLRTRRKSVDPHPHTSTSTPSSSSDLAQRVTQLQTALEQQSALITRLLARIDPSSSSSTTRNRKHPHPHPHPYSNGANGADGANGVNGVNGPLVNGSISTANDRPRSTLWDAADDEDASEGSTGIEQMVSSPSPALVGANGTGAGRKGKGKADGRL